MHSVEVADFPHPVWFRPLSALDWCQYLDSAEGTETASAWLIARCVVDAGGNRLFADDDIPRIGRLSAGFVNRISTAILRASDVADRDWPAERRAFRKHHHERFGYRLARDFDREDVDAFLGAMTPAIYQRFRWSYEVDPPLEDVLRTTNRLLADFLAVYYSVHRDMEQHPEPFSGADFLPQPDEDDDEDAADEVADTDVVPVHPMFAGGVVTGLGPMRGHGAKVPDAITNLFKANEGV